MSRDEYFDTKAYQSLLQELKKMFGRWEESEKALKPAQEIKDIWKIGQKLKDAQKQLRPRFKTRFLSQLSEDLNKDKTQLFRFQQFFEQYPQGAERVPCLDQLSWGHYQETLSVADPKERDFYLSEAARENWPSRRIRTAAQGKLYQTLQLGRSKKHPHGTLSRVPTHFFVYQATVEHIVDPDTLHVMADQGFCVWQRLIGRLRGLNAPELHGPQKELALQGTQFVQESLAGLKQVVVQSHKSQKEKFGRYLVDVFFHPTWEDPDKIYLEGFFLNQMLLDKGFAKLAVY